MKMNRLFTSPKLILFIFLLQSSLGFSQTMGNRMIGMHPAPSQNGNYDSAIYYAQNACVKVVNMLCTWSSLETKPKVYDNYLLSIANAYYPVKGLKVSLNIAPVNTNILEVPTDLKSVTFSDTLMIHRFERLIDFVFKQIPAIDLYSLNIGNEYDISFGTNGALWNQYKVFYDSVKTYIKNSHPNLNVGTTITWAGITDAATKSFAHLLNQNSDIISTTYYGLNSDFTVKQPAQIPTDFAAAVTEYPSTPIYFQECGYPSSDTCKSTEALQSQFIFYVFNTWDFYETQIPYISFLNETDLSQAAVDTLAKYYNFNNSTWKEYLRSLGLRTYPGNGKSKQAYDMLVYLAKARSACDPTGIGPEPKQSHAFIYPNPFSNDPKLILPDAWMIEEQVNVIIYDPLGKKHMVSEFKKNLGTTEIDLPASSFGPGIYFYEVTGKNHSLRGSMIKD